MHVASFMKVGGGETYQKILDKRKKKKRKRKSLLQIVKTLIFFFGGGIAYYTLNFNLLLISLFISFHSLRFYMLQKRRGVQLQVILLFYVKLRKIFAARKSAPSPLPLQCYVPVRLVHK